MAWNRVIGQQRIKELLQRGLKSRQLAHAYLFYGIRGVGKQAMAIEFARALLCSEGGTNACDKCTSCNRISSLHHPDLKLVFPLPVGKGEKTGDDPIECLDADQIRQVREQIGIKAQDPYHNIELPKANFIKINSVRDLKRVSVLTSVEGSWKVILLFDADQMNAEASNSLLKTLEEPSEHTLLILTTSEKDRLLPTIISRCQLIQFPPLSGEEILNALRQRDGFNEQEATLAAKIAQGSYAAAQELLPSDLVDERTEVLRFVRVSLGWKEFSLTEIVDALASSNDRKHIEQWLKVLQTWLRDALVIREAGHQAGTMVKDDEMLSFLKKFPRANLEGAIDCIDDSIALVRKNVYLHLILTTLSFDLRKTLTQGTS